MKVFRIGRKVIGTFDRGVFFKEVWLSKHLFRTLDAWGIDSKTLNVLPQTTTIRIHELEHNRIYTVPLVVFKAHGQYYHFKEERKDHRTQLFLPRKYFTIEKPKELTEDEQAEFNYKRATGLI